jgi:hypothetical protein
MSLPLGPQKECAADDRNEFKQSFGERLFGEDCPTPSGVDRIIAVIAFDKDRVPKRIISPVRSRLGRTPYRLGILPCRTGRFRKGMGRVGPSEIEDILLGSVVPPCRPLEHAAVTEGNVAAWIFQRGITGHVSDAGIRCADRRTVKKSRLEATQPRWAWVLETPDVGDSAGLRWIFRYFDAVVFDSNWCRAVLVVTTRDIQRRCPDRCRDEEQTEYEEDILAGTS